MTKRCRLWEAVSLSADTKTSRRLQFILLAALPGAVFVISIVRWILESPAEIARSDFVALDTGGTLVRTGSGAHLYDPAAQAPIYSHLIGHQYQGILIFNHSPIAALLLAPFSALPLDAAFRLWGGIQLLLLIAAVLLAVYALQRRAGPPRVVPVTVIAVLIGLAAPGVLPMLLEAQELGVAAILLALGFLAWTRGRETWAGALIAAAAWTGKPHLFAGIAVFLLLSRSRRLFGGAALMTAIAMVVSIVALGLTTTLDFPATLVRSVSLYGINGFYGFSAVWSGLVPSNALSYGLTAATGIAGLVLCALCARYRNRHSTPLAATLLTVSAVSLAINPHLWAHDLALLAPLLAAWGADALRSGKRLLRRGPVQAWVLLTIAAGIDYAQPGGASWGRLTPWALTLLAFLAWREATSVSYPAQHALAGGGTRL